MTYHVQRPPNGASDPWVLSYENFFHENIYKTDCEFLRSRDILVSSARATIVETPLPTNNAFVLTIRNVF